MSGFSKSKIISGMGLMGAAFLLRSQYERNCLSTEEFVIRSPKITGKEKTFVFLSDLHDKEFGPDNRRLLQAVSGADPDAVFIGGDMMVAKGTADLSVSLALLSQLAKRYPVYCANGNHESRMRRETSRYGTLYEEYRQALEENGVHYLSDQRAFIGGDTAVYGLDLPDEVYRPGGRTLPEGYIQAVLGKADPGRFSILLAHSPCFFPQYADWGADLTLSGHFHGGTIRLPVLGGVMTPQYQFFYPWCGGCFRDSKKDRSMIVSRGLGTHSVNLRLNNKPQVVVVKVASNSIF